jgi:hypothetical protein
VRAYALADVGGHLAVDVFLRREDVFEALEDALRDEPRSAGNLHVVPIEPDGRDVSAN